MTAALLTPKWMPCSVAEFQGMAQGSPTGQLGAIRRAARADGRLVQARHAWAEVVDELNGDQVVVLGGVCATGAFFNLWAWAFKALRLRRIRFFRLSSLALPDMSRLLKTVIP
jgi:hypothetical protein